ncbi:MAG: phosphatidate cytidylyltransferase [Firmicutes bacterium]|nr:phosphatidate cytidylyltransferase [Bacillota bacterium]
MKQRVLAGVVGTPLIILAIFLSKFAPFWAIAVTLLSAIAAYEMLRCIGVIAKRAVTFPALIYSIVVPLSSIWYISDGSINYGFLYNAAIVFLFIMMFIGIFAHEQVGIDKIFIAVASIIYVTNSFTSLILLRRLEHGLLLLILVFMGAWVTDVFALFSGMLFGKHKLAPKISPKKTVEGAVGGLIFCVISFVIYALVANKVGGVSINIALIILVGVITSIFSQLGDLAASTVKRAFGIKDYGNLIPGHGGIMDRFDSIIAVSPILLVAQTVFNFIN